MENKWIDLRTLDFFKLRFYEKLGNMFKWKSDDIEIPHNIETFCRVYGSIGYDLKKKKWCVGWCNGQRDDLGNPLVYCSHSLATNVESWNANVGEDVILLYNNSLHASDAPIIEWYTDLIKETDISMKFQIINSRLLPILAVSDDRVKKEVENLFESIRAGRPFVHIPPSLYVFLPFAYLIYKMEYEWRHYTDLLQEIKAIDILDNAAIDKMQYLSSFNDNINKRLYNEFGIDIDIKDKRAQVNSQELQAFQDVNTLNYLSYYEERLDFCKRMKDAGINIQKADIPFEVIPCPVFAEEPNEEEIENPDAARELMLNLDEKDPEPEPKEDGKEGEENVSENN